MVGGRPGRRPRCRSCRYHQPAESAAVAGCGYTVDELLLADLRDCLVGAGFDDVRTVLQSGNVALRADDANGADLEARIESRLLEQMALRTDVVARTAEQWRRVVTGNPFPREAARATCWRWWPSGSRRRRRLPPALGDCGHRRS